MEQKRLGIDTSSQNNFYQVGTPEFNAAVEQIGSEIEDKPIEQILNDINGNESIQLLTPILSMDATRIPEFQNPTALEQRIMLMSAQGQLGASEFIGAVTGGVRKTGAFLQELICHPKNKQLIEDGLNAGRLAPIVAAILSAAGIVIATPALLPTYVAVAVLVTKVGLNTYCENNGNPKG